MSHILVGPTAYDSQGTLSFVFNMDEDKKKKKHKVMHKYLSINMNLYVSAHGWTKD